MAGVDGTASDLLLRTGRFFTRWDETDDGRAVFREGGRAGDVFYRDRWSHDKVVRSTHGVNCTGSCSWKVYVKDGIITWETQQTDYPSTGPDSPEYEPRGCPRGAGRPGRCLGRDHRRSGPGRQVQNGAGHGRLRQVDLAGGDRADRRRARAHDQEVRPGPGHRVLADPGDVAGVLLDRHQVPVDDRRHDPVVLRLVRRPA